MREKIAEETCKNCQEQLGMLCLYPTQPRCEFCKLNTDYILALMSKEIKKEQNEFSPTWDYGRWLDWENCRQRILALFKEDYGDTNTKRD